MLVGGSAGEFLIGESSVVDASVTWASADVLDGGNGSPDNCNGEAGTAVAARCEIRANIP